jgi:hypothetical protein
MDERNPMRRLALGIALFVSLVATPIFAQAQVQGFEIHTGGIFLSHLAGPAGEGVDLRLPRWSPPPGVDGDEWRLRPVIRVRVLDTAGETIATIDELEYSSHGVTLEFTTEDIASGYAALLLNGEPTGGELAVDPNDRVEYSLLIFIRPELAEPVSDEQSSGGINSQLRGYDLIVYSLPDGSTRASTHVKVRPLKALKDMVN